MFNRLALAEADLRQRLAEPHRHYHSQSHIDALLALLADKRPVFSNPDAVEIAIWFHDAIYQPGRSDNERESAALMRATLGGLIDPYVLTTAETIILATESHAIIETADPLVTADTLLFLDFDMSVLGATAERYDCYAEGVRKEYAPVIGAAVVPCRSP